jgi:hypothetical protein
MHMHTHTSSPSGVISSHGHSRRLPLTLFGGLTQARETSKKQYMYVCEILCVLATRTTHYPRTRSWHPRRHTTHYPRTRSWHPCRRRRLRTRSLPLPPPHTTHYPRHHLRPRRRRRLCHHHIPPHAHDHCIATATSAAAAASATTTYHPTHTITASPPPPPPPPPPLPQPHTTPRAQSLHRRRHSGSLCRGLGGLLRR